MVSAPHPPSQASLRHPYLDWWGLAEAPFQLEPDPRFAFARNDHREGLARMLFGLTQLGGIVAITGEVGCGKTMLARELDRTLSGDGFALAVASNPPRTAAGVLAALLASLDANARGGSAGRLAARLRQLLAAEAAEGRRPIVVVDEAQRLDLRALDELRLLTNPGDGEAVPVVLLGQPELAPRIRKLPQVAQRVVVRYHLGAMGPDEVSAYIQHRARVAGSTRRLFSSRAEGAAHAETGGIPRLVNLLCANALFVGFVRGESQVGEDLVRDLAEDRDAGGAPDS
jgi:general secretion pathway protein A